MKAIEEIPNAITMGNLVCGLIAIIQLLEGNLLNAIILIAFGMVFDILDGGVARRFGWTSKIGVQLDSLADAVSFVIVPALIVFTQIFTVRWVAYIVASWIAICGVYRLAKFNLIDSPKYFSGMPTPLFTMVIIALVSIGIDWRSICYCTTAPIFLTLGTLMILPIPFPAFKKKFQKFKVRGFGVAVITIIAGILTLSTQLTMLMTAILMHILIWTLIIIPILTHKRLKRRMFAHIFGGGLLAVTAYAWTVGAQGLIMIPLVYCAIASPLIQVAK